MKTSQIVRKHGWVLRFPLGALLLSVIFMEINVSCGSNTPVMSQQQRSSSIPSSAVSDVSKDTLQNEACPSGEAWCSSLDEIEKLALEAIRSLHRQLDDDQNGNIDLAESDEFLREELKYEKNIENRQKAFHRDDDNQVSVRELWETWVKSEVHNWTTEQTAEWLSSSAGLPKHRDKFLQRSVNGTVLPILAVNHNNFLTSVLGIKDSITKQKVAVKAMDVVLFGPPRYSNNYVKDVVLTSLLALALIACYTVYKRYQASQEDLSKMAKDMAELYKAEKALQTMQDELEKARTDQLRDEKNIVHQSSIDGDDPEELLKLREENMVLRNELHRAEVELQDKCWVSPPALQHWLQFTYELELRAYNKKRTGAERQLKQAKDACEKLKKKRTSLMGAFVSTHGRSIDDVDKAILEAKTALTEITHELQERSSRWKQIELLVGCPVMSNPGLGYLENLLRVYGPGSIVSNSQDDMDDDGTSSVYCPSAECSGKGDAKDPLNNRDLTLAVWKESPWKISEVVSEDQQNSPIERKMKRNTMVPSVGIINSSQELNSTKSLTTIAPIASDAEKNPVLKEPKKEFGKKRSWRKSLVNAVRTISSSTDKKAQ